jgi:metal-responsive CopG/Arc/MetJ family transcriptional regulator
MTVLCGNTNMPKVTLNIEDSLLNALRRKAVDTKQSMSDLVNDALKASLQEDLEDIKSWEDRKDEETYGYEEFVKLLQKDGVL